MELISHISFPDLHEKLFAKCFLSLPFPLEPALDPAHGLLLWECKFKTRDVGDFTGVPVVKTLPSSAEGESVILARGAKIPHAKTKT